MSEQRRCPTCIHGHHPGPCDGVVAGPPGSSYGSEDDQPSKCRCVGAPLRAEGAFLDLPKRFVEPKFDLEKTGPGEEPFWHVGEHYSGLTLDRAGMYALIERCQKALADYYAKFPLSQDDVDVDQMRPGRPKARLPLRARLLDLTAEAEHMTAKIHQALAVPAPFLRSKE